MCLVLLHVDALHSKLKGSLAWPTTARREHLTTHLLPCLLQLRSQHPCFRGLEWVEPIGVDRGVDTHGAKASAALD